MDHVVPLGLYKIRLPGTHKPETTTNRNQEQKMALNPSCPFAATFGDAIEVLVNLDCPAVEFVDKCIVPNHDFQSSAHPAERFRFFKIGSKMDLVSRIRVFSQNPNILGVAVVFPANLCVLQWHAFDTPRREFEIPEVTLEHPMYTSQVHQLAVLVKLLHHSNVYVEVFGRAVNLKNPLCKADPVCPATDHPWLHEIFHGYGTRNQLVLIRNSERTDLWQVELELGILVFNAFKDLTVTAMHPVTGNLRNTKEPDVSFGYFQVVLCRGLPESSDRRMLQFPALEGKWMPYSGAMYSRIFVNLKHCQAVSYILGNVELPATLPLGLVSQNGMVGLVVDDSSRTTTEN